MEPVPPNERPQEGLTTVDCGRKMSLATSVEKSPRRYSIMRSNAPRLATDKLRHDVPFGAYDLDTGHRKTISSSSRDCRRFYASSFESTERRFGRPYTSPSVDAIYDSVRLKNSQPATIAKSLEVTPHQYAILRSRYKRFNDKPHDSPDVEYDIDCGRKASLYKSMQQSPISYRNMSAPMTRTNKGFDETAVKLGPGTYDYTRQQDLVTSPFLRTKPLSSMVSRSARFLNDRMDATKAHGCAWKEEYDRQAWVKPVTISSAEYVRPQYLPKAYRKAQA